jgi:ketosteroid isomerase-like protein
VPTKLELLERTLERGFPLGEDIPPVLADSERIERLRDAIEEVAAKDLVVEMVGDESFRRERPGVEGFLDSWRDWVEPFETFQVEVEDVVESGPHLVILVRQRGRPRGGDTEIESEGAAVWTFRGERLRRVEFHLDRSSAMRAAGLDPQSRQE